MFTLSLSKEIFPSQVRSVALMTISLRGTRMIYLAVMRMTMTGQPMTDILINLKPQQFPKEKNLMI